MGSEGPILTLADGRRTIRPQATLNVVVIKLFDYSTFSV